MIKAFPILTTPRGRSAFRFADPEGAPDPDGRRYHAALDWFAPTGFNVFAARSGRVIESRGGDSSGQVFGGTIKVRMLDAPNWIFVYRHSAPRFKVGAIVAAGEPIAKVHQWNDGPEHIHLEVWRESTVKGRDSGYWVPNMVDPGTINWTRDAETRPAPPDGNTLRLVINGTQYAGWDNARGPMLWIVRNGLKGHSTAAISWRGAVWRGPREVENVVKNLVRRFL